MVLSLPPLPLPSAEPLPDHPLLAISSLAFKWKHNAADFSTLGHAAGAQRIALSRKYNLSCNPTSFNLHV